MGLNRMFLSTIPADIPKYVLNNTLEFAHKDVDQTLEIRDSQTFMT